MNEKRKKVYFIPDSFCFYRINGETDRGNSLLFSFPVLVKE